MRKIPRKYKQNGEGKNKKMLKTATMAKSQKRCGIGFRNGVTTPVKTVMFSNIFWGRIGQNG